LIDLYGRTASGNSHKVRLLLALLGIPYREIDIRLWTAGCDSAPKSDRFRRLTVFGADWGQVPRRFTGRDTVCRTRQANAALAARRTLIRKIGGPPEVICRLCGKVGFGRGGAVQGLNAPLTALPQIRQRDYDRVWGSQGMMQALSANSHNMRDSIAIIQIPTPTISSRRYLANDEPFNRHQDRRFCQS